MEVDEIGIFYIEENITTPYRWTIVKPEPTPSESGDSGPMGNGMEYISHVFELVSSEYRRIPTLPGVTGAGGIRMFAIRGRKPNEIEVPEHILAKVKEATGNEQYSYVTPLNTDNFRIVLSNPYSIGEEPMWTEDLEITVMPSEEYKHNLYLQ